MALATAARASTLGMADVGPKEAVTGLFLHSSHSPVWKLAWGTGQRHEQERKESRKKKWRRALAHAIEGAGGAGREKTNSKGVVES